LAHRPHPSRQWLRIRFFAAGPMPKRRSEKRSAPRPGSATPATEDPDPKRRCRRRRRHCSRVRWPRFSHWPPGHFLQDTDTIALIRIRRIETDSKDVRRDDLCGVPSERAECYPVDSQRGTLGLVCDAPSAPLTDGVGSVLDREVD
jgi:hypothetical protein